MTHACHANGCMAEAHPEVPFCKAHFQLLPEPHRDKLWKGRPKGLCGACVQDDPSDTDQPRRSREWNQMLNLGVAVIALVEEPAYDPEQMGHLDEQGFCWLGGVNDAVKAAKQARAIIEKFNLEA